VGLSVEHLVDVPVKKMTIEDTWLVLQGLKNKWIELVEHKFDSLPKSVAVRKRKAAAGTTAITREGDDSEDEEDEDDDNEDEEDEDDDDED
jgi:ribosomal protein L12E/L44/L45/RPP1/RPP2